ncbi:hypothetical protein DPMN_034187 [Dreissena polymorpha]|uniref:Uncharacterized protein n=1 Tax=Dreissena polymorpha TaxID=45954 RepID=A0A9D4M746_DREPO|nr:hypothetical protein DPMN_034187 [Dreissena polymorpha]
MNLQNINGYRIVLSELFNGYNNKHEQTEQADLEDTTCTCFKPSFSRTRLILTYKIKQPLVPVLISVVLAFFGEDGVQDLVAHLHSRPVHDVRFVHALEMRVRILGRHLRELLFSLKLPL